MFYDTKIFLIILDHIFHIINFYYLFFRIQYYESYKYLHKFAEKKSEKTRVLTRADLYVTDIIWIPTITHVRCMFCIERSQVLARGDRDSQHARSVHPVAFFMRCVQHP